METSKILSADLLDLLFDGRNKNYGAYDLRKTYHKRINYALAGTAIVCLLFIAGSLLAGSKKQKPVELAGPVVELKDYKEEEKKVEPPPVEKVEQKVETVQYVTPRIVPDDKVPPEEEIKEITEMDEVKIGTTNQEGVKEDIVAPPVESVGKNTEAPKKDEDVDKIFTVVQMPAEFEGGAEGWRKFLTRNLNSDIPAENGAPPASYTVIVSFVVDRNGNISDVKAENDPGYGTKAEAVRVILKGPKWKPAEQNGRKVIYRHKQSITFQVKEE